MKITQQEFLQDFFSRKIENRWCKDLFQDVDCTSYFEDPKQYVLELIKIPLRSFFEYLDLNHVDSFIQTNEITQCSALQAFTNEICKVLKEAGIYGLSVTEIGRSEIFSKYMRRHTPTTWSRFGNNQAKTAAQLGLAFKEGRRWYLSCFGNVFLSLTLHQQSLYLSRALLRNSLYAQTLRDVQSDEIDLIDYMKGLSPSSQGARSSSVTKMMQLGFDDMLREGIKWHDVHVPKYRAKSHALTDHILKGNMTALDKFTVSDEYFAGGVPMYSVKAACGYFETNEVPEQEGWIDVSASGVKTNTEDFFIVHARGDSMLPVIKDGDLCLFKWYKGEYLYDDIVLTQSREYDAEYESSYTIKRLRSQELIPGQPKIVRLEPLNTEKYHPIILSADDGCDYKTIGIFVKVL